MSVHTLTRKIYYHDTDCGGVVYYANYLKYLEEGRTELFAERGSTVKELADEGTLFVVGKVEITYRAPARYGDRIQIETSVQKVGSASIIFDQKIRRGETLIAECLTRLVCVDKTVSPCPIPDPLREKFSRKNP